MPNESVRPTKVEKAVKQINSIYDTLSEKDCREAWLQTGNHLKELMDSFQKTKSEELQELSNFKNQLNGTNTQ